MTLGIIGLLVGIAVLIIVSYKGFHAIPTSLLAGTVVLLLNGMSLWPGLSQTWIAGLASVFTAYYLLFLFSTLYANVMQETNACTTIAYKLIDWFGTKHIMTVLLILTFLLCYGGVSFFVIMFAVGPIAFSLFKQLNIPRKLIIMCVCAGCGAFVLAAPGSPQIQNVIPTALGTTMTAAPILGWIIVIVGTLISIVYCEIVYKKTMEKVARGEVEGYVAKANEPELLPREEAPSALGGFLPIVTVIVIILLGSTFKWVEDATLLAILSMICGTLVCLALNFRQLKVFTAKKQLTPFTLSKSLLADSAVQAAGSALVLGAVVGFGTVVSSTAAFGNVVEWLIGLNMSPYWKSVVSTGAIAGICGSASSGSRLTMQYLAEYFMSTGANMDIMHRLIANASITFDALPHATGCFLMISYFGTSHKEAYKYVWWLNVVIPVVLVVISTVICSVLF